MPDKEETKFFNSRTEKEKEIDEVNFNTVVILLTPVYLNYSFKM